jgi:hypothetical protein
MDPTGFQSRYMGSDTYACSTAVAPPLRYG